MKNMPQIISIFTVSFFLVFAQNSSALAENSGTASAVVTSVPAGQKKVVEKKTAVAEKQDMSLKARADREIARRVENLNGLIGRINSTKKLTLDEKTTLAAQVQSEITDLTALKTKIDADTDAAAIKTDVKSVVASYRIYALFLPKIQLLAAADRLAGTADRISSVSAQLQQRVTDLQKIGVDTTALQASLSDMQSKVADAKTQSQNAIALVLPLVPAGYPANKSVIQNARTLLQKGQQDLVAAVKDAKSVLQATKVEKAKEGTPSAVPSTSTSSAK